MAKRAAAKKAPKKNKIIMGLNEILDDLKSEQPAKVRMQWQVAPEQVVERAESDAYMTMAADEIDRLRRQNEIMAAKLHVLDLFEMVLLTKPHSVPMGASEDIAWRLRKIVADNKAKKEPAK